MKILGPGKVLTIYVGESDRWHGKPLYRAIVEMLRREGVAGATVTHGFMGFGAHSRIRTAAFPEVSFALPVIIEVVDRPGRIERVLPFLDEMVQEGLVTVHDVSIIKYRAREDTLSPDDAQYVRSA